MQFGGEEINSFNHQIAQGEQQSYFGIWVLWKNWDHPSSLWPFFLQCTDCVHYMNIWESVVRHGVRQSWRDSNGCKCCLHWHPFSTSRAEPLRLLSSLTTNLGLFKVIVYLPLLINHHFGMIWLSFSRWLESKSKSKPTGHICPKLGSERSASGLASCKPDLMQWKF